MSAGCKGEEILEISKHYLACEVLVVFLSLIGHSRKKKWVSGILIDTNQRCTEKDTVVLAYKGLGFITIGKWPYYRVPGIPKWKTDIKHQAEHNTWTGWWATLRLIVQLCRTELSSYLWKKHLFRVSFTEWVLPYSLQKRWLHGEGFVQKTGVSIINANNRRRLQPSAELHI